MHCCPQDGRCHECYNDQNCGAGYKCCPNGTCVSQGECCQGEIRCNNGLCSRPGESCCGISPPCIGIEQCCPDGTCSINC